MLTLSVLDMSNRVNTSVKEAAQTKDYMPPVQRFNQCYIQQSIIGNRFRELLHTTAVILTYTDSDAKD